MQGNPRNTGSRSGATCFEIRQVIVVDAFAHLYRHWNAAIGGFERRFHDVGEQVLLPRQRTAPALAGHLGNWTPEVHVDVIRAILVDDDAHRLRHHLRIYPVQLHRARRLVGGERHHVHGCLVAFDQCAAGDHLRDVEASTRFSAQSPKRPVRDAGHRSQNNGRIDDLLPHPQRHPCGFLNDTHPSSIPVKSECGRLRCRRGE